jgi:formylglycine-generating enzyme required for sulfatase activity
VQPVLDAACVRCHNGSTTYKGTVTLNLRGDKKLEGWVSSLPGSQSPKWGGRFTVSYANLFPYLHTGGIESNMGLLDPMEFHASTSELVQMLKKGHFGVNLDQEQWERLATWIDLNAPFHGDWNTIAGEAAHACEKRRAELRQRYGNVDEYHIDENPPEPVYDPAQFLAEVPARPALPAPAAPIEAGPRKRANQRLDLGNGKTLEFTYIPAGSFEMGGAFDDETPRGKVRIARGFWMATTELTNELFHCFDSSHDSGREHLRGYAFGMEGYPLNEASQPVVRVSWTNAMKFCEWLSRRTGRQVTLPTEAQWEYACRSGSNEVFNFGKPGGDFSLHANLSDAKTREFASDNYLRTEPVPIAHAGPANDYTLKDDSRNDGALVSGRVGAKMANHWGLHDMHGNVAEWTRSLYRSYPYDEGDGRNSTELRGERVVRGGSWRDRPFRAASGFRNFYNESQPVVDVGIRLIIDEDLLEFPSAATAGQTGTSLHPTFANGLVFADSGAKALRTLKPDGQLRTLMTNVYCYDLQVLRSGNILFCDSGTEGSTTREITQEGRTVWEYKSPGEVFSCQRLEDGSTLIAECTQSRVRIVSATGEVKHSVRIEVGRKGHKALRWARLSDKGELWVAQMGDRCIKAYDLEGKVLRSIECGEEVFGVQTLAGGEVLFSTQHSLTKISPQGGLPWKLTGADIPEVGVKWLCGFQPFKDGSVLLCNWLGHGEEGKGDSLVLVDKDKRVLWRMPSHLKTTWVAAAATL